jgi:hypothetical protein
MFARRCSSSARPRKYLAKPGDMIYDRPKITKDQSGNEVVFESSAGRHELLSWRITSTNRLTNGRTRQDFFAD